MASCLLFLLPCFQLAGNCATAPVAVCSRREVVTRPGSVPPDAARAAQYPARMHPLKSGIAIIGIGDVVLCGSGFSSATILMGFTPEKNRAVGARCNGHGVKPEHRARRPLTGSVVTALRLLRRGGFSCCRLPRCLLLLLLSSCACCALASSGSAANRLFSGRGKGLQSRVSHLRWVQVHRFAQQLQ